jgi:hypothetical protein
VGSRPVDHPRFVVGGRSGCETALPEANSFLSECQPFDNIGRLHLCARDITVKNVTNVNDSAVERRGLTQGNLVSTLEQSPARGDTAAIRKTETAPAST